MDISCSSLAFARRLYPDIEDIIRQIRRLGFTAMDLAAIEGWETFNPSEIASVGRSWVDRFVRLMKHYGLRLSSMNCRPSAPLNDDRPDAFRQYLEELSWLVAIAESTGCPNITLQSTENAAIPKERSVAIEHGHLTIALR